LVQLGNIHLVPLLPETAVKLPEVQVTPWLVPHRNEFAETFAFLLQGPKKRLLYLPDLDRVELWERPLVEVARGLDYLLLDATFYSVAELAARGRDYAEIPHPLVVKTMQLLQPVVQTGHCRVIFTHLNHTNPLLEAGEEAKDLLTRGFLIAEEGMELKL
jgi:pyrroloquinoline quinone biosynthesis protein B